MRDVLAYRFGPKGVVGSICLTVLLLAGFSPLAHGDDAPVPRAVAPLRVEGNNRIAIPREAFGREFLLSIAVIPQAGAPTSRGLAGKIVRFVLYPDGVDLDESVKGLVVTTDLPARRLITRFPIVAKDNRKVVIDFNAGMQRVFTAIWYGGGRRFDVASRERVLEVPQSRVFESKQDGEEVVIRQSVQVRDRERDSNRQELYEVRYFLRPYVPDGYRPAEQKPSDTRYAQFFTTQAQLEPTSGRTTVKMIRFDLAHPITFYYSANTPPQYVEAVRQGILYWNRAFGRDVVQAKRAPDGVTAPDPDHNMVQWVPWDNAGFAYADLLVDPRTGEACRGQAYITSVFAILGRARARMLLRAMRGITSRPMKMDGADQTAGPNLFDTGSLSFASLCPVDERLMAENYAQGLEAMLDNPKLTDRTVLRISRDYVTHTVAHEVGHILGLRHNFAGSLGTMLTPRELDQWFEDYAAGKDLGKYAGKVASSSVMEYSVFKAAVFDGHLMRTAGVVLPHDKAAIRWGYFGDESVVTNHFLFGTDQDVGKYGDLLPFDYGAQPVVSAYAAIANTIHYWPNDIIERFIRAKAPRDPRDREPLKDVTLSAEAFASQIVAQYSGLLRWFNADTRSLRIENQFDFISDLNQKARYEAHWKSLTNQIQELGGVDRALFSYLPVDLKLNLKKKPEGARIAERINASTLTARLKELLVAPAYRSFVGLDGKTHHFTDKEKALILERGRELFQRLGETVLRRVCVALQHAKRNLGVEATGTVGENDVVAQFEKRVIDFSKAVLTAKDDTKRIQGKVDQSLVEVIKYKYKQQTRLAAAMALNDKIGSFPAWATDAKGALHQALQQDLDAALNLKHFKDFQPALLTRPLRSWYLNQQAILKLLPPQRKPGGS